MEFYLPLIPKEFTFGTMNSSLVPSVEVTVHNIQRDRLNLLYNSAALVHES